MPVELTVLETPVELTVLETSVELGQTNVEIVLESATMPGPPGAQGPQGEPGPQGEATTPVIVLTQAEYDALTPPDPESLYVIID